MEWAEFLKYGIAIVGALLVVPVSTTLHELGHALPALLWTREKPVKVFLGAYGGENAGLKFSLGRLKVFVHGTVFRFIRGRTDFDNTRMSSKKFLFLLLNGSLFSLLWPVGAFSFALTLNEGVEWKLLAGFWLAVVIIQSLKDLVPNAQPIFGSEGTSTFNDGYLIKQTLRFLRYPEEMQVALKSYWNNEYKAALEGFESAWKKGKTEKMLFQSALECCQELNEVEQGVLWSDRFHAQYTLNALEHAYTASFYSAVKRDAEALRDLNNALAEDPDFLAALMNRGFLHLRKENYEAAHSDMDRALQLNPKDARSWASRGYARIWLERKEEALRDLEHAAELDPDNPFVLAFWGFYCLQEEEMERAQLYFDRVEGPKGLMPWVEAWKTMLDDS